MLPSCADCREERLYPNDIHDAREIVGENKGALVDRGGVAPAHMREYSKIDSHGMFAT